jgi:hypothetical protein
MLDGGGGMDSGDGMLDGGGADMDNDADSGDDMPQDDSSMEEREAGCSVACKDTGNKYNASASLYDDGTKESDSDSEASWKLEDDTASHYSGDSQDVYAGRGNKGGGTTFSWRIWAAKFGGVVSDGNESAREDDIRDAEGDDSSLF